jgi:hypothetical protein
MTPQRAEHANTAITRIGVVTVLLAAFVAPGLLASGQAGIYGVIERVVFEPNAQAPERAQIWGAFALIEVMLPSANPFEGTRIPAGFSFTNYVYRAPARGYLYFKAVPADLVNVRREWADLAAVAGTGQAVAFGYWDRFQHETPLTRVRAASDEPVNPDPYYTDIGVTKLPAAGRHAAIVASLQRLVGS